MNVVSTIFASSKNIDCDLTLYYSSNVGVMRSVKNHLNLVFAIEPFSPDSDREKETSLKMSK